MISGDYLCGNLGVSLGYDFLHFADLDFEILTRAILKEDGRFYIGVENRPATSEHDRSGGGKVVAAARTGQVGAPPRFLFMARRARVLDSVGAR